MSEEDRKYHPLSGAQGAYVLFKDDIRGGWSWLWEEPNESDEIGPTCKTKGDAYRSIADDWEETGGELLPRFVGMMRGLGTKADRAEGSE